MRTGEGNKAWACGTTGTTMKTFTPNKIEGVIQKPIMTSVYTKYVHCEEKQNPGSSQQTQYGSNSGKKENIWS